MGKANVKMGGQMKPELDVGGNDLIPALAKWEGSLSVDGR